MNRLQQGSLFKLARKSRPAVWASFRWYDNTSGKRISKKQIIRSVAQIRNKREAEKAVVALAARSTSDIGTPNTICDLAEHIECISSTQEKKSISRTIDSHHSIHVDCRFDGLCHR